MTKKDFTAFAKCELTEEEYVKILKKNHPEVLSKKVNIEDLDNKKA